MKADLIIRITQFLEENHIEYEPEKLFKISYEDSQTIMRAIVLGKRPKAVFNFLYEECDAKKIAETYLGCARDKDPAGYALLFASEIDEIKNVVLNNIMIAHDERSAMTMCKNYLNPLIIGSDNNSDIICENLNAYLKSFNNPIIDNIDDLEQRKLILETVQKVNKEAMNSDIISNIMNLKNTDNYEDICDTLYKPCNKNHQSKIIQTIVNIEKESSNKIITSKTLESFLKHCDQKKRNLSNEQYRSYLNRISIPTDFGISNMLNILNVANKNSFDQICQLIDNTDFFENNKKFFLKPNLFRTESSLDLLKKIFKAKTDEEKETREVIAELIENNTISRMLIAEKKTGQKIIEPLYQEIKNLLEVEKLETVENVVNRYTLEYLSEGYHDTFSKMKIDKNTDIIRLILSNYKDIVIPVPKGPLRDETLLYDQNLLGALSKIDDYSLAYSIIGIVKTSTFKYAPNRLKAIDVLFAPENRWWLEPIKKAYGSQIYQSSSHLEIVSIAETMKNGGNIEEILEYYPEEFNITEKSLNPVPIQKALGNHPNYENYIATENS